MLQVILISLPVLKYSYCIEITSELNLSHEILPYKMDRFEALIRIFFSSSTKDVIL